MAVGYIENGKLAWTAVYKQLSGPPCRLRKKTGLCVSVVISDRI